MIRYEIWNKDLLIGETDLLITPKKCQAYNFEILGPLPQDFLDLTIQKEHLEDALTIYLNNRIPPSIRNASDEELLQILGLKPFLPIFSDIQQYKFLPSFLWHFDIGDGIVIYPKTDTFLCLSEYDERFVKVYRINKKSSI